MKIIGAIFLLLAIAIGVVPQYTNCGVHTGTNAAPDARMNVMKCHWTAMATPAVSVPLFLAGAFLLFSRRGETMRVLAVMGAVLGCFAILLPTKLIGVCANDAMICNVAMKPTLIFSGTIVMIAGLAGLFLAGKSGSGAS
jgi:hypothetical protein